MIYLTYWRLHSQAALALSDASSSVYNSQPVREPQKHDGPQATLTRTRKKRRYEQFVLNDLVSEADASMQRAYGCKHIPFYFLKRWQMSSQSRVSPAMLRLYPVPTHNGGSYPKYPAQSSSAVLLSLPVKIGS